jgi:putative Holliday junction resolvase
MCPGKTIDLATLRSQMRPGSRLLGLDVGAKTVGIAVSDGRLSTATPVETIRRKKLKDDAAALGRLIADRDVGGLIVGLPMNMDGSEGPRCQSVRQFAANIAPFVDLPIAFWDERLSTVAVERTLIAQDVSRRRRDEVIDAHAAAFILQGALDRLQVLAKEN